MFFKGAQSFAMDPHLFLLQTLTYHAQQYNLDVLLKYSIYNQQPCPCL